MDQNEVAELSATSATSEVRPSQGAVDTGAPAQPAPCPTCGGVAGSPASYVYALGQIETRFPRPSVEKEVAQATGRAETAGQTDRQAFQRMLLQRENRYLARQLCWVLTVQGLGRERAGRSPWGAPCVERARFHGDQAVSSRTFNTEEKVQWQRRV